MYKLGVEMEVIPRNGVSKSEVLEAIREAGISVQDMGYTHRIMSGWKCVSDSSLTYGGFELVSPPMKGASNIDNQIKTICKAIKGLTRIDRTCGIHIHFEVLDKYHFKRNVDTSHPSGKLQALKNKPAKLFTAKLLTNYSYFQSVIDTLVPESRRSTQSPQYCRAFNPENSLFTQEGFNYFVNSKETYAHLPSRMGNKFQVVNVSTLESYGTVEFRQHGGSTNATKILNWIRIMERLVSRSWDRKYAKRNCRDYNLTIDGFMDFLGFGQTQVRNYSRNRARNAGFSAISAVETQSVNTQTSEEHAAYGSSSNATLTNSENMALSAEVREACFILDNDRDYYNQIATAINRFDNNQIRRIDLHFIVKNILRMHPEIPWFPTEDNFRAGQFVKAVIIYYLRAILE